MKIAAALPWYDEPLESLERCLGSISMVADVLVIADGRWRLFADDRPPYSPPEQRELVEEIARELRSAGVRVVDLEPLMGPALPGGAAWRTQVAKRSTLYAAASSVADWTLAIDADEHVEHVDLEQLHHELEATDRLTATIGGRTAFGPSALAGTSLYPRLFSSAAGYLSVQGSHNGVRAGGRWLTGDPAYVPLEPTLDVSEHLRIYHDQGASRPRERELADRAYRTARRRQNVEGWPPRRANRA